MSAPTLVTRRGRQLYAFEVTSSPFIPSKGTPDPAISQLRLHQTRIAKVIDLVTARPSLHETGITHTTSSSTRAKPTSPRQHWARPPSMCWCSKPTVPRTAVAVDDIDMPETASPGMHPVLTVAPQCRPKAACATLIALALEYQATGLVGADMDGGDWGFWFVTPEEIRAFAAGSPYKRSPNFHAPVVLVSPEYRPDLWEVARVAHKKLGITRPPVAVALSHASPITTIFIA